MIKIFNSVVCIIAGKSLPLVLITMTIIICFGFMSVIVIILMQEDVIMLNDIFSLIALVLPPTLLSE